MLSKEQIAANRENIVFRLVETGRDGVENLIAWMDKNGFFTSPASTKYHGCYAGGLAAHSMRVLVRFLVLTSKAGVNVDFHTAIIACFLHDLCKVGAYRGDSAPYRYNGDQPKGHSLLSIERISEFLELSDLERKLIRFHMGVYGSDEFCRFNGEYTLKQLTDAWNDPAVKLMSFADEMATLEEKAEESVS